MKGIINSFIRGLFKNTTHKQQPEGTIRFALNAINETSEGDQNSVSNEESNEECFKLPEGYIPIGKVYIGDNEVAIFSVSDDGLMSEIGVADSNCNYVTHVNGKLGFKLTHQIDATYRLRRGCDKTIYWVDGPNNPPMSYNFSNPEAFKTGGLWDKKKFSVESTYNTYPKFTNVEVEDGGGSLPPGSYNIGIQYVDESLNATPIITTTATINIYNSSTTDEYIDIEGSVNSVGTVFNFPATSKSIKIEVVVDTSFKFYRLAFIEFTSGDGTLTAVKYSDNIPTNNTIFVYRGDNYLTEGSIGDIMLGGKELSSGDSIEQIDNRLVIANTTGQTGNLCEMQAFVSEITTDLTIREVVANSVVYGNTKSPTNHFEAVGYMPGEIYSFGIFFIYEDNTESPVYHIPGKNATYGNLHVFSPGPNVYPMSIDNTSVNNTYLGNGMCGTGDYWGKDSNDDSLEGVNIRHHRFPYRDTIGIPMVEKTSSSSTTLYTTNIILNAEGTLQTECTQEQIDNGDCSTLTPTPPPFLVRITLTVNGNTVTYLVYIDPADYSDFPGEDTDFTLTDISDDYYSNAVVVTKIEEQKDNGDWEDITDGSTSTHGLTYDTSLDQNTSSKTKSDYKANVYGVKFSNINLTAMNAVSDKEIIGYHIVRNERKETDKTILDSAVLTPCVNSNTKARKYWGENSSDKGMFIPIPNVRDKNQVNFNYLSNGLLSPEFHRSHIPPTYSDGALDIGDYSPFLEPENRISKKFFGLLYPEYKFNGIKYENVDRIRHVGTFDITTRRYNSFMYLDVNDVTYYNEDVHKSGKKWIDKDGMALRGGIRDATLNFSINTTDFNYNSTDINNISYLSALANKSYTSLSEKLTNLSADNRTGIIELKNDDVLLEDKFPYVYLEKDIADPYTSFRSLPYYKINNNIETTPECEVFDGDVYITPMRYFSSLFIGNQEAARPRKTSVWKIIAGTLVVIGGTVLAIFTFGAGAALIPVGVKLITSGASEEKIKNAYEVEYGKGLSECLIDADTFCGFKYYPSYDDEVQWFGEVLTDLWFESQVNISLRHDTYSDPKKSFLDAPGVSQGQTTYLDQINVKTLNWPGNQLHTLGKVNKFASYLASVHLADKLLDDSPGGKKYTDYPPGELFELNPDFDRMNKQKVFFQLGIEYDCCSECQEEFPHRVWYSEQSFQEELSDNYKIFLPNNYRDITGETGRITDLFKIKNNLYIHTEEALWHLPASHQEKVIDQIVSYIGTGEFFSIPPMIVLDDEQSSGGSSHKWATIKVENSVFFISERERKPYYFDGKNLRAISGGLSKWFADNMKLQIVEDYAKTGLVFPNPNNPSNPQGAGFIAIYDPQKDRVIFTKRDQSLRILAGDHLCYDDRQGEQRLIKDYQTYINDYADNGWKFEGFINCSMIFSKKENPDDIITPETIELSSDNILDNSWTISYSPKLSAQVKDAVWLSWHSYLPRLYLRNKDKFYSWITGRPFWKHGKLGGYQNFYGKHYPFIIEFVSAEKDLKTKIWDYIELFTEASKYDSNLQEFKDDRFTTFNKAVFYNSRQSSGVLNLMVKDLKTPNENYLLQQVENISGDTIIIDKDEKNWHINDIRDYVINQSNPLFTKNIEDLQTEYFIDKKVNSASIDHNKDWYDVESFRDKYLSIRLIFDNFDDVKLLLTHSISYTVDSERQFTRK